MIHSNSNDHHIRQVLVDGSAGGSSSGVIIELFVWVVKLLEPLEVSPSLQLLLTLYTVLTYLY